MDHPGCVDRRRGYYDDAYRHFIRELREQYADVDLADFAYAVPPDMLEQWRARGADTDTRP